ncbi:hypothetical protein BDV95DRAFT_611036 [Massariosphaeria phaeospora]|uniref:Mid2 domain-containing protein n=1 Tax=Massariosphaeria phaeospora TaxID=100035 RepID=A0A7C8MHE8_9PLEO|nr:hypothetical protein BDV95DRAFT_611036 [Massariosphaeria phaeospora]
MASQITTPPHPHLPRQTFDPDPFLASLSQAYEDLMSVYPALSTAPYPYSYSFDDSYYSSLLADLESLYPSAFTTLPDLSALNTRSPLPTGTAPASSNSDSDSNSSKSGGLSTGAKIGIGVAVPLAVLVLAGIGIFLWCAGRRKGKKTGTTIVAPQGPPQPQPQMGYAAPSSQGYIQGFQQQPQQQQQQIPHIQSPPPPQYMQPHPPPPPQNANQHAAAYGYAKGPSPGVVELEQEYHFARPGVVEMGDGADVGGSTQGRR